MAPVAEPLKGLLRAASADGKPHLFLLRLGHVWMRGRITQVTEEHRSLRLLIEPSTGGQPVWASPGDIAAVL